MSEFRMSCEQFLATTRQHFFASDPAAVFEDADADEETRPTNSDAHHRAHVGK